MSATLTPAAMFEKEFDSCGSPHGFQYFKAYYSEVYNAALNSILYYNAHMTAAKDERIKELEEQVKMRHAAYLESVAENEALEDDVKLHKSERDQAFALLEDWAKVEDLDFTERHDDELSDLGQILKRRNTLLSSRENKKQ